MAQSIYQCHSGSRDITVCVSWYHSLVSMSVRPTQFDPDPVSLLFPTPPSLVVCACQFVLSVQSPDSLVCWWNFGYFSRSLLFVPCEVYL